MKNLRLYDNHQDFINDSYYVIPNISRCQFDNHNHIMKGKITSDGKYFTVESLSDNNVISFVFGPNQTIVSKFQVSLNKGITWSEEITVSVNSNTILGTLNTGEHMLIKGTNNTICKAYNNASYNTVFTTIGEVNVSGNMLSLLYGDNFTEYDKCTSANYVFSWFFSGSNIIDASNLYVPYGVGYGTFYRFFSDSAKLKYPPKILHCDPTGKILSGAMYTAGFSGCTSLIAVPELPATTLNSSCYQQLFSGCTSLRDVSNLKLNAMVMSGNCYYQMFYNTRISEAPELPATTLASGCYQSMFSWCPNLVKAPELPAKTLVANCYNSMFWATRSLNYVKCLATDISATDCTKNWIGYSSNGYLQSSGIFIRDINTNWPTNAAGTYVTSGIPINWEVYDAYDSEIEYLTIPQNAYVDSGYIPNNETGMMYECIRTGTSDTYYMGLRQTSGNTRFAVNMYSSTITVGWGSVYILSGSYPYSQKTKVEVNMYNSRIGGVGTDTKSLPTLPFTPTLTIYLGGANVGYSSNVGKPPQHHFYSAQITQGSELIMDFIPVRVGQVGYMYDKISHKLFGNSGTDTFILGPDI